MHFGQHERINGVVTRVVNYAIIFKMSLVFGQRTSTDLTGISELFVCEMSFCCKRGGNPKKGCQFLHLDSIVTLQAGP
jgi:hypothetical protein